MGEEGSQDSRIVKNNNFFIDASPYGVCGIVGFSHTGLFEPQIAARSAPHNSP